MTKHNRAFRRKPRHSPEALNRCSKSRMKQSFAQHADKESRKSLSHVLSAARLFTRTSRNSNNNVNTLRNGGYGPKMLNKWTAFFLCLLFGWFGAHKFYEGRIFLGIVYLLSFGLFGFGWVIDTLILLFKPNPYYV